MKKLPIIFLLLRLAIGGLFVYTSFAKLMEPSSNFAGAILSYQIVDARTASWTAIALPWVELAAGVFFILGLWLPIALSILWGLNTIFIAAITSAMLRHIPLHDCGCFGQGSHSQPIEVTLVLDIFLFLVFVVMVRRNKELIAFSLDSLF